METWCPFDRKLFGSGVVCLIAGMATIWNLQGRAGLHLQRIGDAAYLSDYFQYRLGPNLRALDLRGDALRNVGWHVTPLLLFSIFVLILTTGAYPARRNPTNF